LQTAEELASVLVNAGYPDPESLHTADVHSAVSQALDVWIERSDADAMPGSIEFLAHLTNIIQQYTLVLGMRSIGRQSDNDGSLRAEALCQCLAHVPAEILRQSQQAMAESDRAFSDWFPQSQGVD
jgi:hypothetical protein